MEPWGTPTEVAEKTKIPEKTLAQWRWQGTGPKYMKIGRHIRYRWSDVEAWAETQASAGR